jgi:hypothetical protein
MKIVDWCFRFSIERFENWRGSFVGGDKSYFFSGDLFSPGPLFSSGSLGFIFISTSHIVQVDFVGNKILLISSIKSLSILVSPSNSLCWARMIFRKSYRFSERRLSITFI